jgi:hypothetical protein
MVNIRNVTPDQPGLSSIRVQWLLLSNPVIHLTISTEDGNMVATVPTQLFREGVARWFHSRKLADPFPEG